MTTETKNRLYIIQNEEGAIVNVFADNAPVDIALITTSQADAEGNVTAGIQRASVEAAASQADLNELEDMMQKD